jgi:hypothetical protein
MIRRQAALQLAAWIQHDVEEAQIAASATSPSSQRRLVAEALRQLTNREVTGAGAAKLLGISQSILGGTYQFFDEPEAVRRFEEIVAFAAGEESPEVNNRAFTVAALLLHRVRDPLRYLSDETINALRQALAGASHRQKSVVSAILARVDAAALRLSAARSRNRRKFAVPDLDIPKAAKNVGEDVQGDWYQDPWGWPEVEWLARAHHKVMERLSSDRCTWTVPVDVSKRGGGVRPGMVINPLDRVAFQSLVDELSLEAAGHLPSWVHGWRLSRARAFKGAYEPNKDEWRTFARRVAALCKDFSFTAHIDIQAFFPTIDTSRLLAQLSRRYRNAAVVDRLEVYFDEWHRRQNGLGIPQRSLASSVLAHAVLRPLDLFLDQRSGGGKSSTFIATRWMDDIWLHSDSELALRTCVREIENLLADSRLSLNADKTEVFLSKDADKLVQLVDEYEEEEEDAIVTLRDLLDRAEGAPPAPGFHIGFEVSKILARGDFGSLAELSSGDLSQFTYVASALAKLLRRSGGWKRLSEPYLEFAKGHVSGESLAVAAWAEMFPNNPEDEVAKVQRFFSEKIINDPQRLLTPLAAQRLAAWSQRFGAGNLAAGALKIFQEQDDLFRLRGVAFAALQLGGLQTDVAHAFDQVDDGVTNAFLKDSNFEAPALSRRFEAE